MFVPISDVLTWLQFDLWCKSQSPDIQAGLLHYHHTDLVRMTETNDLLTTIQLYPNITWWENMALVFERFCSIRDPWSLPCMDVEDAISRIVFTCGETLIYFSRIRSVFQRWGPSLNLWLVSFLSYLFLPLHVTDLQFFSFYFPNDHRTFFFLRSCLYTICYVWMSFDLLEVCSGFLVTQGLHCNTCEIMFNHVF